MAATKSLQRQRGSLFWGANAAIEHAAVRAAILFAGTGGWIGRRLGDEPGALQDGSGLAAAEPDPRSRELFHRSGVAAGAAGDPGQGAGRAAAGGIPEGDDRPA